MPQEFTFSIFNSKEHYTLEEKLQVRKSQRKNDLFVCVCV